MPAFDFGDCWFLTGPTAGGKSAVGVELARRLDGEVLSMDSMAVYRGLDIGTAKPTAEQLALAPHRLIDLVDPDQCFSLSDYLAAARQAVADARARARTPIFVGGTPLYLKGLLRGVFAGPPADWQFRREQEQIAERHGPQALHARLAEVDPLAAGRLHPSDTRRVIRALEVWTKTGRPISELQRQFNTALAAEDCRAFVIEWPREALHRRIDARVEAMFAAGLIDEARGHACGAQPLGRTARQALGYREALEHLSGQRDLPATIALVKLRTRQFAKRQGVWFRSLSELRAAPAPEPFDPIQLADQIIALASGGQVERRSGGRS
jgi:tRNA dimethylallyltransferase